MIMIATTRPVFRPTKSQDEQHDMLKIAFHTLHQAPAETRLPRRSRRRRTNDAATAYGPGLSNFLHLRHRMHHAAFRLVRVLAPPRCHVTSVHEHDANRPPYASRARASPSDAQAFNARRAPVTPSGGLTH